ncbi:MAG: FKBP-type peptidyl-prolyl cis-trans isomerase [Caulobacteraceae bacterium]
MTHRIRTAALLVAVSAFAVQAHAQAPKPAPASEGIFATAKDTSAPANPATEFMTKNGKEAGVTTTASGLEYKVLQSGPAGGASPKLGDEVQVVYEGRLLDGKVFDSSTDENPAALQVGELVPGWNEALQMMKPGDEWQLFIPPNLGYGDEAKGPIPGGSVMVFKMKLLSVGPLS